MLVILCGGGIGFPNGSTAPTARVLAYANGLTAVGEKILVLCVGTSEDLRVGVLNTKSRGIVDGVEFEYTCGTPFRGSSFLRRRWFTVKGLIVAAWRILSLHKKERVEALLLYPDTLVTALWFWLIARLCGASYLLEKSERPFSNAPKSYILRLYSFIYLRTVFRLFDGIIVISEYLRTYLTPFLRHNIRIIKIPIMVDASKFSFPVFSRNEKYIAYCGTLNQQKDGVLTLLKAYAIVRQTFQDVKLYLIGDSYPESQIPRFRKFAEELGIADSLVFTGIVGRAQLPEYLTKATILALARPSSHQADAGFPTKLGEYLATGNPVVVTTTGELMNYLEDGVNAYLCSPDDEKAFAERLDHVLSNPDEARQVGISGRIVAQHFFDPKLNAERLRNFIRQL